MISNIQKKISDFPTIPGVYLMKGKGGEIIYVGKAKNLKARVKNYFTKETDSRYQIQFLLGRLNDIDYLVTSTEKEALLLEASLIKKHKPRYNVFFKDDKSYISLRLGLDHLFPRLIVTRKIKKDGALYFGPYSSAESCRQTIDFIYRHFQLRTCSDHDFNNRSRPCLEYQIKRCTAPCVGYVTREQYAEQVLPVRLFLEGKNEELLHALKEKMTQLAKDEAFEQAAKLRDLLGDIEITLQKQRVVRHEGGNQDLIYLYREGDKGVVALCTIRQGSLLDSRYYHLNSLENNQDVIEKFLTQHYGEASLIPDEMLVFPLPFNCKLIQSVLSERKGKKVALCEPKRGDKKNLLGLAKSNAMSHFKKWVGKEYELCETLKNFGKSLGFSHPLDRMECYDISNLMGKWATASRVVFMKGEPCKEEYRHYKIRCQSTPDDYAMMREVLLRRFRDQNSQNTDSVPDLLILDGGKGHLGVALSVLNELGLGSIPVIAIAKGKGKGARAKGVWKEKKEEGIYLPHRKNPMILKRGSPELMLLQRIRDEAHRFAVNYHKKLRDGLENTKK